jgi:hypothetical protein
MEEHLKFKCYECDEYFTDRYKRYIHSVNEHDYYKFVCHLCGEYIPKRLYTDHLEDHFPRKLYECCNKTFTRHTIMGHYKAEHPNTPMIECCNRKMSWVVYKMHRKTQH